MAKDSMQPIYIALGLIFLMLGYVAYEHMHINKKLEKASLCKAVASCTPAAAPSGTTTQGYAKSYDMPSKREKYERVREPRKAN